MSYNTNGLSFNTLRSANIARLPQFKNKLGGPAHSMLDGSDWSPNDWMVAVMGEVGELAGDLKSLRRGDFGDLTEEQIKEKVSREMADIVTYLDLLAMQFGINLGDAVIEKFNIVSERVGSNVILEYDDWHYTL